MTLGTILNIQRFCTDDGPGIRTTVFLKGCPMRCIWCHNPESQSKRFEISYDADKCTGCLQCGKACPQNCHSFKEGHAFDRARCIGCGACAEVCPSKAILPFGMTVSVSEVLDEIKKDKIFYETSGGGVTVSGGEPLFQPRFTSELLCACRKEGIHTAIETSGVADESSLLSVIEYCDLILFDVKETDEELHKRYTGVSLRTVMKNLEIVNEKKTPFIIRAPIIPTLNDRSSHFEALSALGRSMGSCLEIQIMPYHRTGSYKYHTLGRNYLCRDISEPDSKTVDAWRAMI